MPTQPQRDIIRDGFANIQANQSDAGKAASSARATEFKDQHILTQPTDQELNLAFAADVRTHLAKWLPGRGCSVGPTASITQGRFSIAREWR